MIFKAKYTFQYLSLIFFGMEVAYGSVGYMERMWLCAACVIGCAFLSLGMVIWRNYKNSHK